jgi:hypothetical protein
MAVFFPADPLYISPPSDPGEGMRTIRRNKIAISRDF